MSKSRNKTPLNNKQFALLHIYPTLAGLTDLARRQILETHTGCTSSKDEYMDHHLFELAMAAYETLLWDRVQRQLCPDPRVCRTCGRRMRQLDDGRGQCPEGCETRKVYAWTQYHWRNKVVKPGQADSRQIFKLREAWNLLRDYLPAGHSRSEVYLAGIIQHAIGRDLPDLVADEQIQWDRLTPQAAIFGIEAVKDRLRSAVAQKERAA